MHRQRYGGAHPGAAIDRGRRAVAHRHANRAARNGHGAADAHGISGRSAADGNRNGAAAHGNGDLGSPSAGAAGLR